MKPCLLLPGRIPKDPHMHVLVKFVDHWLIESDGRRAAVTPLHYRGLGDEASE